MSKAISNSSTIKVVGKSWVIRLPDEFTAENDLEKGTQVLLTFRQNDGVEAEVLPPLSKDLKKTATKLLKKRRKVYEELKRLGD